MEGAGRATTLYIRQVRSWGDFDGINKLLALLLVLAYVSGMLGATSVPRTLREQEGCNSMLYKLAHTTTHHYFEVDRPRKAYTIEGQQQKRACEEEKRKIEGEQMYMKNASIYWRVRLLSSSLSDSLLPFFGLSQDKQRACLSANALVLTR
jgi:hypothetical protein